MTRTLLFDLDGTLVDSAAPIGGAVNAAFEAHDLPVLPDGELRAFVGPPLYDTFEAVLVAHGRDPDLVPSMIAAYREVYAETSLTQTTVYPGIRELLDRIRSRARLGVVTSKPRATAIPILHALALIDRFEFVEGPALSSQELKPQTLARAMRTAGVVAANTFMIGDRRHDIEAGLAHGLQTIGVTWGFGAVEELTTAGAHHLVNRPDELDRFAET
jgi:phosphoglycolate phosphatase